jgi:hypothetical protein
MTGKVDRDGSSQCWAIPDLDVLWDTREQQPDGQYTSSNHILNFQFGTQIGSFYRYDARGNLTYDQGRAYVYDSFNRMITVSGILSTSPQYEFKHDYDGNNLRVTSRKGSGGMTRYFVRDLEGSVLSEFRRTAYGSYPPEWMKHHVYLAGREVALRENRRPAPPEDLQIATTRNATDSVITLRWHDNPEEDQVTAYNVYRSTAGSPMSSVGVVTTACPGQPGYYCFTDGSLTTDTRFDYQITAASSNGESYASDTAWIQAGDTTAPAPPICLRGTAGDAEIRLTWQAGSSTDVLGYNVYYSAQLPNGLWSVRSKANTLLVGQATYVVRGLANYRLYRFYVQAVDHGGRNSPDSQVLQRTMPRRLLRPTSGSWEVVFSPAPRSHGDRTRTLIW